MQRYYQEPQRPQAMHHAHKSRSHRAISHANEKIEPPPPSVPELPTYRQVYTSRNHAHLRKIRGATHVLLENRAIADYSHCFAGAYSTPGAQQRHRAGKARERISIDYYRDYRDTSSGTPPPPRLFGNPREQFRAAASTDGASRALVFLSDCRGYWVIRA